MTPRCVVCGRDPDRYPHHERLHKTPELDASRVGEVESGNLTLRDSLGLPPGSGAALPPWPSVPANLPGIGAEL